VIATSGIDPRDSVTATAALHPTGGCFVNTYTGISDCYDLLMRAGYYEHDAMAKAADAVMGERARVLELGVGTGLFAQSFAEVSPDCEITGVDFTASMLEIARERVGERAELIEADVTCMELGQTFDAAVSSGGVWVVIRDGEDEDEFMLGTHLSDFEDEVRGLQNVNHHLEPDGLLLLSIQDMHRDFDQELDGGIVYSQSVLPGDDLDDGHYTLEKQYRFTRGSEVLAEQTLHLGFYRRHVMNRILELAGFAFDGIDDSGRFFVYGKVPIRAGAPA
jgi:SAM-dependent methyltransferase